MSQADPPRQPEESGATHGDSTADENVPLLLPRRRRTGQIGTYGCLPGFWISGLLNNFAFVVFITAAEDVMTGHSGSILLANTLPGLLISLTVPFFMERMTYGLRVAAVCLIMTAAFLGVASATSPGAILLWICCGSIAQSLGELTFLAMCGRFPVTAVGAWSSGTGAAGLAGAGVWILLKDMWRLETKFSMLCLSPVPLLIGGTYIALLRPVVMKNSRQSQLIAWDELEYHAAAHNDLPGVVEHENARADEQVAVPGKLGVIRKLLLPFMVPLFTVYLFEYLINQGMFLPLGFALSRLGADPAKRTSLACRTYRDLQLTYQVGVLVSRSSVAICPVRVLWPLPLLQVLNFIVAVTGVIFRALGEPRISLLIATASGSGGTGDFAPSVALHILVLWEGLLGGATYVNSYTEISRLGEALSAREFALGVTSLADSSGVIIAAGLSLLLEPRLLGLLHAGGEVDCG